MKGLLGPCWWSSWAWLRGGYQWAMSQDTFGTLLAIFKKWVHVGTFCLFSGAETDGNYGKALVFTLTDDVVMSSPPQPSAKSETVPPSVVESRQQDRSAYRSIFRLVVLCLGLTFLLNFNCAAESSFSNCSGEWCFNSGSSDWVPGLVPPVYTMTAYKKSCHRLCLDFFICKMGLTVMPYGFVWGLNWLLQMFGRALGTW